uniref:Transmembrane and coiled-coil domain-containing protein 4 n=1 Tax=Trichuris muris TaxID=70415 RepID=A0A5S6Q8V1_TRIMR
MALAELVAHLLQQNFNEDWNKKFRLDTLNILSSWMQLPECRDRNAETEAMLTFDHRPHVDELLQLVMSDTYVQRNGSTVLLLDLIIGHVRSGIYDSRYRCLLLCLCRVLRIEEVELDQCEEAAVDLLKSLQNEKDEGMTAALQKRKNFKRLAMIGAGGAVGGLLIGLTGGLATPVLAMGLSALAGSTALVGLTTSAGAAVMGSLFGITGACWTGYKLKRRIGAVEEFTFELLNGGGSSLCVTLAVSGWITENFVESFRQPWTSLNSSKEQWCLRYESEYLLEFGKAVNYIVSMGVTYAVQHALMETSLAGVLSAVAWPVGLIAAAGVIDNPWNVCMCRAKEVGEQLAGILIARKHGNRPVSLFGFSVGARVIYHCLLSMAAHENCQGIIMDVVLLGAPVGCNTSEWTTLLRVAAGRVVNGYSRSDWLLKFLYRAMNLQATVAGLGPVMSDNQRLENCDLSSIISSHGDYMTNLTTCLKAVGIRTKLQVHLPRFDFD